MNGELDLTKFLASTTLFADVSPLARAALASRLKLKRFAKDELILRQGEPGDSLYLVVTGSLRIVAGQGFDATVLAEVAPPASVGELAILTGHPRGADVYANRDSLLAELSRADFEQTAQEFPADMAKPTAVMARLLRKSQLSLALRKSNVFGSLDEEVLRSLENELELVSLSGGEVLFRQGDAADSLYIVVSGRLRVRLEGDEDSHRVVTEFGRGEMVGEMGLITVEPRSATVSAIRDSIVARLDRNGLGRLSRQQTVPLLTLISRELANRLRDETAHVRTRAPEATCIACIPLTPQVAIQEFCDDLAKSLAVFGDVLALDSRRFDALIGRPGAAESSANDPGHSRGVEWLSDQESRFRHVIYQGDRSVSVWTERCLRQADHILLIAEATDDRTSAIGHGKELLGLSYAAEKPATLVLLHEMSAGLPTGTSQWLRDLPVGRHLHVRKNHTSDVDRVARFLNGRSVGLALGGGFARGIAHIGVIRAMREMGIPIDMVGGTSMGSVIASQCGMEWDCARMLAATCRMSAAAMKGDYTLPFVSFLSGAKMRDTIVSIAQGHDMEDSWLPLFSISASLTTCQMKVHDRGDAAKSILASTRAPGLLPPVPWEGELLVDGGLVNMVPADVMKEFTNGGPVVAVDVSPRRLFEGGADYGLSLSGWDILRKRADVTLSGSKLGLTEVLMRTIEFGRAPYDALTHDKADLYVVLPLKGFKFRDFHRGPEMVEIAYAYARTQLDEWRKDSGEPWAKG